MISEYYTFLIAYVNDTRMIFIRLQNKLYPAPNFLVFGDFVDYCFLDIRFNVIVSYKFVQSILKLFSNRRNTF